MSFLWHLVIPMAPCHSYGTLSFLWHLVIPAQAGISSTRSPVKLRMTQKIPSQAEDDTKDPQSSWGWQLSMSFPRRRESLPLSKWIKSVMMLIDRLSMHTQELDLMIIFYFCTIYGVNRWVVIMLLLEQLLHQCYLQRE